MKLKAEDVVLDDGKFEMLLIPEPKSVTALNDMLRALVLQDYSGNGLILRHASRISVTTAEPLAWSLDGEYTPETTSVEIENLPQRLEMRL